MEAKYIKVNGREVWVETYKYIDPEGNTHESAYLETPSGIKYILHYNGQDLVLSRQKGGKVTWLKTFRATTPDLVCGVIRYYRDNGPISATAAEFFINQGLYA